MWESRVRKCTFFLHFLECVWANMTTSLRQNTWFPGGSEGKESACNSGDLGLIPGVGRSPGEGNGSPLQYSCLENPMDGGACQATVHGSQRVGYDWTTSLSFSLSLSVFLPSFLSSFLSFFLRQIVIGDIDILVKQGNHKFKTHNRFTQNKKKRT